MANFFLNCVGVLSPLLKMIIAIILDFFIFVVTFHFSILLRVESFNYSLSFVVWNHSFFFGSIAIAILLSFGCYHSYIRYFGRVSAFKY
jgi:predicted membrane chloride channel (bestrophin family)